MSDYKSQLIEIFEYVSGCQISDFSEDQLPFLADYIIGQHEADNGCIEGLKSQITTLRQKNSELVEDVMFVVDTFKKDLDAGFKTRDKEFAVDLLSSALQKIKEQK